jgi:hypothetical protein
VGFSGAPLKSMTPFGSAERLTNATSEDQNNYAYTGAIFMIDITAFAGGTNVVFTVQGKDPIGGDYYTLVASAAQTATLSSPLVLEVRPDITTVTANVSVAKQMPKTFRVIAVVTGTFTQLTYSVACILTP